MDYSRIEITQNIYGHTFDNSEAKLVNKLNKKLNKKIIGTKWHKIEVGRWLIFLR